MSSWGGWKTRVHSTMRTNSRLNALLNESNNLLSLVKRRNLNKLKDSRGCLLNGKQIGENGNNNSIPLIKVTEQKYCIDHIRQIIIETLTEQLNEDKFFQTYSSEISPKLCQILARDIKNRIKLLNYDRFRIVCFVTIIEKLQQAIDYKMVFCLDTKNDNYTTFTWDGATFSIVATVFLVYKD